MTLLARLLAVFLLLPIVELILLIQVDRLVGFWPTIGLIVATGLAGGLLARHEGLSVWQRFSRRLASGQLPGNELIDGVLILMSGALLITPGVLTDVIGFLGLLPPSRTFLRSLIRRRLDRSLKDGHLRVVRPGEDLFRTENETLRGTPSDEPGWRGSARETPRYTDVPDSDA